MSNLFDTNAEEYKKRHAPLAARMRPKNLDEFMGQDDVVGKGRLLRRLIEADLLTSAIFYGPPGSGKTTLALIIANTTKSAFFSLSAVTAGVADIRGVIKDAETALKMYGKRTVLFIDEIHRFNKGQQDALLPSVEDGTIILIGATTENPYFEVNKALLSRARIFRLQALMTDDIIKLLKRAVEDSERGFGGLSIHIPEEIYRLWAETASGDVRVAYSALELAVITTAPGNDGIIRINIDIAHDSIQRKTIVYDKSGDHHYDVISAFIKSMRGSDPNAALYWLALMIEAGENPEFIVRRIIICAAEDVGLADPQALAVAIAAANAVHWLGWPEARIPLAEAVIYVATAPKSNSAYLAIDQALAEVRAHSFGEVPLHLRSIGYKGAADLGHGVDYKYAHNYPHHYVKQQYLPEAIKDMVFYYPGDNKRERTINEYWNNVKNTFDTE